MSEQAIARAYDAIAVDYDRLLAGDNWMRAALQSHYLRVFRQGQRVLDIGCGTGLDATFLAQHGIRVVGIDVSPRMVAEVGRRASVLGVEREVSVQVANLNELASLARGLF